jgi:RNA polymerase primary sigma factor
LLLSRFYGIKWESLSTLIEGIFMPRVEQRAEQTLSYSPVFLEPVLRGGEISPPGNFAEFVKHPVNARGENLLEDFNPPRVLALLSSISHSGLSDLILESFSLLPINIGVTRKNLGLFAEAGLEVEEGEELIAADLEERFPPIIIAHLRELALKKQVGRQSVFSQGQFLEAYLEWTRFWFGHLCGETSQELSSKPEISLRAARERLRGKMPRELFCIAQRGGRDYGFQGELLDTGRELTLALGVLLFRGKLAAGTPSFWKKLGVNKEALGINLPALYELCALLEEQGGKFFFSLESGEKHLITKKLFDLYGSAKDEGISLFRSDDEGLRALRQIQEYLASQGVYTSIFSQKAKQNLEKKEMFRLFVPPSQLENFKSWSEGGKRSDGVGVWGATFLSRLYFYKNKDFSEKAFRFDLQFLRERRENGDDVPSESSLRRWRQGRWSVPNKLGCFFNTYGLDQTEEKRQIVLQAGRLYLRQGEEVVHKLKERFPLMNLHRLTKAFLSLDSILYRMPEKLAEIDNWQEEIDLATDQWGGLLELSDDDLRELLELKLVKKGFPEALGDETLARNLPEGEPVDLSEVPADDTITLYLKEAAATPLLSSREEKGLARLIEKGRIASVLLERTNGKLSDSVTKRLVFVIQNAQRMEARFIKANTLLVIGIAGKYFYLCRNILHNNIPFLDLIQEGNIGLMKAVEKFDWRRGYKFSTYATWWARQTVSRFIEEHGGAFRMPAHTGSKIRKIARAKRTLEQWLGYQPTSEEVAQEVAPELGISPQAVLEWMTTFAQVTRTVSLERPIGEDEKNALGDFVEDVKAEDPEQAAGLLGLKETIDWALDTLTPRQARILRLRCGLADGREYTLEEVGQKFGLTRERIRQIEAEALRKLRHPRRSRQLKRYL